MKQKTFLLIFLISITFLLGFNRVCSLEYKLTESSNDPITCKYVSTNDDSLQLSVSYKDGNFSVYFGDDITGLKLDDVDVTFNEMSSKKSCPEKIDVESDDSGTSLSVKPLYNKVHCGTGEGKITGIPKKIPKLTSLVVTIVQVAVPVILVLMGSLDLFKSITAGKEDEMKKGQQIFIKRLIIGASIFFVIVIVKFFVSIVADTNVSNIVDCIDCFVDNNCLEGYE